MLRYRDNTILACFANITLLYYQCGCSALGAPVGFRTLEIHKQEVEILRCYCGRCQLFRNWSRLAFLPKLNICIFAEKEEGKEQIIIVISHIWSCWVLRLTAASWILSSCFCLKQTGGSLSLSLCHTLSTSTAVHSHTLLMFFIILLYLVHLIQTSRNCRTGHDWHHLSRYQGHFQNGCSVDVTLLSIKSSTSYHHLTQSGLNLKNWL